MKPIILYSAMSAAVLLLGQLQAAEEKTIGQKAGEVIDRTVEKSKELGKKAAEKTKEAGHAAVEGAKKATEAVKDAVSPDADARKVEVTLSEHKIDMPRQLAAGKTAFVVRNAGKQEHSFEIAGEGLDKKYFASVDPESSKTLHVELKPSTYQVRCPIKDHDAKGMDLTLTVK